MGEEGANVSGPAVAAQKFDLQGIGREKLDDGPNIPLLDLRIVRPVEHGYHVQKFHLPAFGHVECPGPSLEVTEYNR